MLDGIEDNPLDKGGFLLGWEAEDSTAGLGAASSGLAAPLPGASAVASLGDAKQEQERAATAAMEHRLGQLRHKDAVDKKRKEAAARKGGAGTPGATAVKSAPAQPKAGEVAEPTLVTEPGAKQQSG